MKFHTSPKTGNSVESIPLTQEVIRTAVLREMRDWLLKVKDQSSLVGRYAMSLTLKKNEIAQETMDASVSEQINLTSENSVNSQNSEAQFDLEAAAQVDFTPLYQCIHIHDVLGKRNLLKIVYDENRRLQAEAIMKKSFTFDDSDLQSFHEYMEYVSGFFIVDALVIESTTDFRSRYHVIFTIVLLSSQLEIG